MSSSLFDNVIPAFRRHSSLFGSLEIELQDFAPIYGMATDRYMNCLRHKKLKHHPSDLIASADEYTSFLVFLAAAAYSENQLDLAESAYLINRRMNGFDCFYTRSMPDIFHLEHPLGAVLGNAVYGNYFVCYQAVTIGGDRQYRYPTLHEGVVMYAHSLAIGSCELGTNSCVGANAMIFNQTLEDNMILRCQSGVFEKVPNKFNNIGLFFCGH
ncbi:hypothetical protein [Synechococcus sp. CCY 9618]|uniref:hypothetical protein n=1 Tax=Synechococcus sp. CCY 9618 TaxID=2815602 RepID=UPI001C211274|nr:hypothetical protein [Synechococcus sp. CCY 9618]